MFFAVDVLHDRFHFWKTAANFINEQLFARDVFCCRHQDKLDVARMEADADDDRPHEARSCPLVVNRDAQVLQNRFHDVRDARRLRMLDEAFR